LLGLCYTKHIEERQTIPWPNPTRTNNVIQNTSNNVRQYHGQNQQGQAMQYKTHRRTSGNIMAKTDKDKQCYTKHHCLSLSVLAMILPDVLRCVLYNIVCLCWFWPWHCLTFFDVFWITLFVLVRFSHDIAWRSKKDRQYNSKTNKGRTDNTIAKQIKEGQTIQ
jgi:hypothetical protein